MTAAKTTKTVTAKTTGAPKRTTKRTIVVDHLATAKSHADNIVGIIDTRTQALAANGVTVAVEWAKIKSTVQNESFPSALAALLGVGAIEVETLVSILPNWDSAKTAKTSYVQAKTVQKIVNMIFTLASNDIGKLSDYTSQVLYAALVNGNALSITGAHASLSKRVSNIDLPNGEQITNRASYTPGTANAQASQVRDVLRVLGLATVDKGKKGDTFVLNTERVEKLRTLYALDAA